MVQSLKGNKAVTELQGKLLAYIIISVTLWFMVQSLQGNKALTELQGKLLAYIIVSVTLWLMNEYASLLSFQASI